MDFIIKEILLRSLLYFMISLIVFIDFKERKIINFSLGSAFVVSCYIAIHLSERFQIVSNYLIILCIFISALLINGYCFFWLSFFKDNIKASIVASFGLWMHIQEIGIKINPDTLAAFFSPKILFNIDKKNIDYLLCAVFVGVWFSLIILLKYYKTGVRLKAFWENSSKFEAIHLNANRYRFLNFILINIIGVLSIVLLAAKSQQISHSLGIWILVKGVICISLVWANSITAILYGAILLSSIEVTMEYIFGTQIALIIIYTSFFIAIILQYNFTNNQHIRRDIGL